MSGQGETNSEVLDTKALLKEDFPQDVPKNIYPTVLDMQCNILQKAENPFDLPNQMPWHMGEDMKFSRRDIKAYSSGAGPLLVLIFGTLSLIRDIWGNCPYFVPIFYFFEKIGTAFFV